MGEPRLEPGTIKVRQLVDDYRSGRIVIPEFQRDYVWRKSKAPKLIDSLYRRYPISSLLLWSSTEVTQPRRRKPVATRAGLTSWLIDGQQRVITLSRAIFGDDDIDVVFHAAEQQFRLANSATKRDPNWFSISRILDEEQFREVRRNLVGPRAEALEREFDKLRRILDYEVPFVRMADHSFDDAVGAFSRINTLGVKLKAGDIESAKIAARHSGFIADNVAPFLDRIRAAGFTRLNVMHLFRLCAFVATPDLRAKTPLHELDSALVRAAWEKVEAASTKVLQILSSELGLVGMDILWSGALLVPPMAIAASRDDIDDLSGSLLGWIAAAALLHRYSKAVESSLDQDLKACRKPDPIGALLTNIRRSEFVIEAVEDDFDGSIADRGALFGMYVACRQQRLRIGVGPSAGSASRAVARRYILPRENFPVARRPEADCIANAMFASDDVVRLIRSTGKSVDLSRLPQSVLRNHCIPTDPELWSPARAPEFWAARRALLTEAFNLFLKQQFPARQVG